MSWSLMLETGFTLWKERDALAELREKASKSIFGTSAKIAVLGATGSGKTAITEHLVHQAQSNYVSPGPSSNEQTYDYRYRDLKLSLQYTVIPGLRTPERIESLTQVFHNKEKDAPDGVIYIASYGFGSIKYPRSQKLAIGNQPPNTLEEYRQYFLERELLDLTACAEHISICNNRFDKPAWMIVVANKVDLYYKHAHLAHDYYAVPGKSQFTEVLQVLQSNIGADNFTWHSAVCCSHSRNAKIKLVDGDLTIKSQLAAEQIRTLVGSLEIAILEKVVAS